MTIGDWSEVREHDGQRYACRAWEGESAASVTEQTSGHWAWAVWECPGDEAPAYLGGCVYMRDAMGKADAHLRIMGLLTEVER